MENVGTFTQKRVLWQIAFLVSWIFSDMDEAGVAAQKKKEKKTLPEVLISRWCWPEKKKKKFCDLGLKKSYIK